MLTGNIIIHNIKMKEYVNNILKHDCKTKC